MCDHTQACPYCPKYDEHAESGCSVYQSMRLVKAVGCPLFPFREIPRLRGEYVDSKIVAGSSRPGQQKQKKVDRTYNNARSKRKYR